MEREKKIIRTSIIGILANVFLVIFKALVGFFTNSLAIILDAVNNLTDVIPSVVTIVGTKLAGKAPDKEHPYGHGRIEYLTSLIVSEIIREQILKLLDKEIPHGTAVVIERMRERETSNILDIEATIYCEKQSHKGIIIGKGGSMLKKIGTKARYDLEDFFSCKVNLQCWVKVKEEWRQRAGSIHNLGLDI